MYGNRSNQSANNQGCQGSTPSVFLGNTTPIRAPPHKTRQGSLATVLSNSNAQNNTGGFQNQARRNASGNVREEFNNQAQQPISSARVSVSGNPFRQAWQDRAQNSGDNFFNWPREANGSSGASTIFSPRGNNGGFTSGNDGFRSANNGNSSNFWAQPQQVQRREEPAGRYVIDEAVIAQGGARWYNVYNSGERDECRVCGYYGTCKSQGWCWRQGVRC